MRTLNHEFPLSPCKVAHVVDAEWNLLGVRLGQGLACIKALQQCQLCEVLLHQVRQTVHQAAAALCADMRFCG